MPNAEVLVEFARRLREEGVAVSTTCAGDLMAALEIVGAWSSEDVYWAFRALTVRSREQVPSFDRVFMDVFGRRGDPALYVASETVPRTWAIEKNAADEGEGDGEVDELLSFAGASLIERLADKDFSDLTASEEAAVRALIARMLWKPADVYSRRRRPVRQGDRPDLRRTLRRSVGADGDLLRIASTERRRRKRPLIFIADVSGSMERYSEMLLYFAHAARGRMGHMEAFVFSTRLTRITRELHRRDPSSAIAQVSEAVHDWSGGTRIGDCIRTFNVEWSRRVARGGPIVLIISDGWDRGEPEILSEEMARLARSVHRVIWLNPLAGRQGYAPETRGMKAALPHVDDFLPVGSLSDLATLVELLEAIPARAAAR
ncbi:MAG: VWA domain-containing protein [Acidimicrobiia bacterium]